MINLSKSVLKFYFALFLLISLSVSCKMAHYHLKIDEKHTPKFSKIDFDFKHQYNGKKSLPVVTSSMIDINNDGIDEVFFGGGYGQNDQLFEYKDGKMVNISSEVNLLEKGDFTSVSSVSADFDNNGFVDLIVGREDGLHIYYNTDGKFSHKLIQTEINEKSTPAGITVGDIDKDGDLDIFLSTYIKKELTEGHTIFEDRNYGSTSALLLNEGNESFKNITIEAGLDYVHNTFMALLVDIDGDLTLDLVIAYDTGEVRTYKNNGNLTFTMMHNPLTNKFAYPMGIAAGDYNNDGRIDFMFSNTGSTIPRFFAKGDIKDVSQFNEKWILFRNDGGFKFTDVAKETKIANYEFAWGAVFADMNNDGLQDLMVAENYVDLAPVKFLLLPSRMLIQREDHIFVSTESKSGVKNPCFAITPIVSDFNKDGYLDMIWVNIDSPSMAFLNNGGNKNFIQVKIHKNAKNIGAKIEIITSKGTLTEWLLTGEGLGSDQTGLLHFGLGEQKEIKSIAVTYLSGERMVIENPAINTTIYPMYGK